MAKKRFSSDPAVDAILIELYGEVKAGHGTSKKFSALAEQDLIQFFAPKIAFRLSHGGVWAIEKPGPLKVAKHLGQICKILSQGNVISPTVAMAAAIAVRDDEICPARGGTGQWCV
jgi:hypothetical protein